MTFAAGDILLASELNSMLTRLDSITDSSGNLVVTGIGQDRIFIKSANETVNNSAAMQNDDHIVASVVANATYEWQFRPEYLSQLTPDLKFQWTVPASATMVWGGVYADTAGGMVTPGNLTAASVVAICGAAADFTGWFTGTLVTAATAGNCTLQWAQNTANATNTIMYLGTYFRIRRTA